MTEDKTTKITTLDDLDSKILEQQARLKEEKAKLPDSAAKREEMREHLPFTAAMEDAFKDNIKKSTKCLACNWQNFGKILMMMNYVEVMKESLPVPTLICGQCGGLFVPKWARKVMKQAIEQENRIIKQEVGAEAGV